jgi:hypothetical protein
MAYLLAPLNAGGKEVRTFQAALTATDHKEIDHG